MVKDGACLASLFSRNSRRRRVFSRHGRKKQALRARFFRYLVPGVSDQVANRAKQGQGQADGSTKPTSRSPTASVSYLNGALGGGDLAEAGRAVHDEGHGLDLLVRVEAGHAHVAAGEGGSALLHLHQHLVG
eukprot:1192434-Prorocentrum_minimum.AAC.3